MAISRVGSVVGPLALGWIVALQLPVRWNFYALMVPTVVGVLVVLLLPRKTADEHPLKSADDVSASTGSADQPAASPTS